MSEAKNPVRDRTLVLRVLVPSLEARLREKMEEAEKAASSKLPPVGINNPTDYLAKEFLLDLDGIYCEPTQDGSTRWNFRCDGAAYPARLVNLPCPVEVHKTHDHVMYYKSSDVSQLLVVYEDEMAMEEAEAMQGYKSEDYPSYYHSGLTPPLKRVVERRFEKREHKAIPPPRTEVSEIEEELRVMIDRISDSSSKAKGKNKTPTLSAATSKVIEEVVEEIVDYQPWMDDYGRQPKGIQFEVDDPKCTKYPELWLDPREAEEIVQVEMEKEDRKAKAAAKKEEKKSKKKNKKSNTGDFEGSTKSKKKGIAKKSTESIDEVTQAATEMMMKSNDIELGDLDGFDIDDTNFLDLEDDTLDLGDMDFS